MPRKLQPTKVKPHGMIELEDPLPRYWCRCFARTVSKTECRAIVQEHSRSDELSAFGLAPGTKYCYTVSPAMVKPSLAEALAFELAIPFLRVKYSSLISGNLGGTARNIDDVLEYAHYGSMSYIYGWVWWYWDGSKWWSADVGENAPHNQSTCWFPLSGCRPIVPVVAATSAP